MTDEQMRIKIAEARGWRFSKIPNEFAYVACSPDGEARHANFGDVSFLPDYLNDLNAMHEAVSGLCYELRMEFQERLANVVGAGDAATYWWESDHYRDKVLNATARQRAEAFLKTLEEV